MISNPKVSVLVHTFNQVNYIRGAIEGVLAQKTRHSFEVIVHDDCSTDGTGDIVKQAERDHPDIVRAIVQAENRMANGVKPSRITRPYARGEYIALCEGDDYWCDPEKLEIQVNLMDRNPEIALCATSCLLDLSTCGGGIVEKNIRGGVYTTRNLARSGGSALPTASLVFRRDVFEGLGRWFDLAPVGDYYLQVLASRVGQVYVFPRRTCVYRVNAVGSWTSRSFTRRALFDRTERTESLLSLPDFIAAYSKPVAHIMVATSYYTAFVSSLRGGRFADSVFFIKKSFSYHKTVSLKQFLGGVLALAVPMVLAKTLARRR